MIFLLAFSKHGKGQLGMSNKPGDWSQYFEWIIISGYYMAAWRHEFLFECWKNISRVNEWNILQHKKRNFVSPSGHEMFCLFYKHQWNTKPFRFLSPRKDECVRTKKEQSTQPLNTNSFHLRCKRLLYTAKLLGGRFDSHFDLHVISGQACVHNARLKL